MIGDLLWTHWTYLLRLDDINKINYYIKLCEEQNLSTRQLDYYVEKTDLVDYNEDNSKIKYDCGTTTANYWWLRSVMDNNNKSFYLIGNNGGYITTDHGNRSQRGVSSAFRIGTN